ncbi:MAG TPA: hypothetical protein VOA41_16370 [Candidatus Dormibacteraeota bacterium]|nr:hypothetical protein [Candidatus Dormibacteraeota bacterium]
MVLWKVVLGAVLVLLAVVRVLQALPFMGSQVPHEWLPVMLIVMAVFFIVGMWLLITGLRGKKV